MAKRIYKQNQNKTSIICSAIAMHPKGSRNYEQALHSDLEVGLFNFPPLVTDSLSRFDKSVVPFITSAPLDVETIENEFSRYLLQNAIDLHKILTPEFQLYLAQTFLNCANNIVVMSSHDIPIINNGISGSSFMVDLLKVPLEEQGYTLVHNYFNEIELYYRATQDLGTPLFFPSTLSTFEFLIGECTYKAPEKFDKDIRNERQLQKLMLQQICVTAKKTLKNYSPRTFSKCEKYIREIEKLITKLK
ncbi:hypothetical protein ACFSJY_02745 [Thalassotalea euphylliae]|uniref:hypothetical protein n=1 Tax=Thalassotalea euphylliae TaxID=1655234 RepID=UPI00362BD8BE